MLHHTPFVIPATQGTLLFWSETAWLWTTGAFASQPTYGYLGQNPSSTYKCVRASHARDLDGFLLALLCHLARTA